MIYLCSTRNVTRQVIVGFFPLLQCNMDFYSFPLPGGHLLTMQITFFHNKMWFYISVCVMSWHMTWHRQVLFQVPSSGFESASRPFTVCLFPALRFPSLLSTFLSKYRLKSKKKTQTNKKTKIVKIFFFLMVETAAFKTDHAAKWHLTDNVVK